VALPAGTQLGRYTVLKPLVSGGMAEVLLARAQGMAGFQHHVVIKAIRANKSTDPNFIKMFVEEARLSASLHHAHVVQVHDVGHEGNDYFFAMEYVHGENLRRLLTKVARASELVPLDQVITIVLAVAAGLHHAHQQNIVHRDVTPANILVGYDGNVKVTDFGIAKAMLQSTELTKSGTMRGKVAYMAPEQCLGRKVDRRSDIFSLGIVLYELCTSRRLFKGDTDFMVMTSIVNGKIPKPTQHRSDLPLDLEDVILKALAPSPHLRFDTAEDLAIALEQVAVTNGIRVSPTALGDYLTSQFGTRPEPWLVTTGLVVDDVDFDGGGTGLVEVDDHSDPAIDRALLDSPILAGSSGRLPTDDPFADDPKTEINDPDDEPPTLSGDPQPPPTSGFEGDEKTLIGDRADVDMLVNMSRIEGRRDDAPVPRRDATPVPRRDATPMPRRDATPVPRAQTPVPVQPVDQRAGMPQNWGTPDGAVTGTPMAWVSNEGEVTSLAPRGRRVMLIAAVAIPLVAIGVFVITRDRGGGTSTAKAVEPDAFVEPPPAIDAAAAAVTPDATPPIDARAAATIAIDAGAPNPVAAKPAAPVTKPRPVTKKPPITKRPPLKR